MRVLTSESKDDGIAFQRTIPATVEPKNPGVARQGLRALGAALALTRPPGAEAWSPSTASSSSGLIWRGIDRNSRVPADGRAFTGSEPFVLGRFDPASGTSTIIHQSTLAGSTTSLEGNG